MRHTLIPFPDRKKLRHEYRIRVAIVLCFMLSVAGIIGSASLFPTFIRVQREDKDARVAADILKKNKDANGVTDIEKQLAEGNILLGVLASSLHRPMLSAAIADLVGTRQQITITSVAMSRSQSTTTRSADVILQGKAPTRESLLSFKDRIEKGIPGSKVDLPISELSKSRDIQFSITVKQSII